MDSRVYRSSARWPSDYSLQNPITGENDITMIVFDNRLLANTMPQNTTLGSNMSVDKYYQMVEKAAKEGNKSSLSRTETFKCN